MIKLKVETCQFMFESLYSLCGPYSMFFSFILFCTCMLLLIFLVLSFILRLLYWPFIYFKKQGLHLTCSFLFHEYSMNLSVLLQNCPKCLFANPNVSKSGYVHSTYNYVRLCPVCKL